MAAFLLRALILLSLSLSSFSLYSPFLPSMAPPFINAAKTLIDSDHLSMSLTLQLISQSLLSHSNSLTIFAPPDFDFIQFGQPSFSLLNAHISPRRIPIADIKALPQGSTLPTLSPEVNLLVTSSFLDGNLSINNVGVEDFTIFDDGLVVIYAIDHFFNTSVSRIGPSNSSGSSGFDPNSTGSDPKPSGSSGFDPNSTGLGPKPSGFGSINPVMEALRLLRSRGYVKMATFLDMQLGLQGWPMQAMKLTIFAPIDEAIDENIVTFGNYSTLFRSHVVPGLLRWLDLVMIKDGTHLETFSEDGFRIDVSKSGDLVVVNGVPVSFPDMYCADWLVVHGLNKAVWPVEGRKMKLSMKSSSSGSDYDLDFEDYYGDLDEELGD